MGLMKCCISDLAVGAPYEEGSGAVYIYLGSKAGIVNVPSQKILASSISPLLKGFGISLSRGLDMDHNNYPGNISVVF